jgi:hypothetical protein
MYIGHSNVDKWDRTVVLKQDLETYGVPITEEDIFLDFL